MVDMLSQEEINALLNDTVVNSEALTEQEIDALGEIGNINMGTAATTLFTLLGQKVTITAPSVKVLTYEELTSEYSTPYVIILVKYVEGVEGFNVLILKEEDVKIITDLMMGGDGTNVSDELTDMHLSAIGEAMNQMIGSSSTSLSEMIGKKVDISPPVPSYNKIEDVDLSELGLDKDASVVRVEFDMTVSDLIASKISQIMTIDVAKQLVKLLMDQAAAEPEPEPSSTEEEYTAVEPVYSEPQAPKKAKSVNAKPVLFESFDEGGATGGNNNINIIRDIPLEITVELGRTKKKIKEILEFSPGSVLELNKVIGESLDVLANGKKIATGEVVVVDDNYGIKISDILVPEKRLNNI